jgi:hypothetical protein
LGSRKNFIKDVKTASTQCNFELVDVLKKRNKDKQTQTGDIGRRSIGLYCYIFAYILH